MTLDPTATRRSVEERRADARAMADAIRVRYGLPPTEPRGHALGRLERRGRGGALRGMQRGWRRRESLR